MGIVAKQKLGVNKLIVNSDLYIIFVKISRPVIMQPKMLSITQNSMVSAVSNQVATRAMKKSIKHVGRKINSRVRMTSINSRTKAWMKGVPKKINSRVRMTRINSRTAGGMEEVIRMSSEMINTTINALTPSFFGWLE